ncbi:glutamate racemase, partial [Francisella tularensis subsp. holarctica]|nr:glutamate racemase [Francisella tularensis subsp. holarctica]
TTSRATIPQLAVHTAKFLIDQEVKAIISACKTLSAIAKDIVQEIAKAIPVREVITAGVRWGDQLNTVGVSATPATSQSNA